MERIAIGIQGATPKQLAVIKKALKPYPFVVGGVEPGSAGEQISTLIFRLDDREIVDPDTRAHTVPLTVDAPRSDQISFWTSQGYLEPSQTPVTTDGWVRLVRESLLQIDPTFRM